jgi:hypothetical protein
MHKDKEYYNKNLFLHSYDSLFCDDLNNRFDSQLKMYGNNKLSSLYDTQKEQRKKFANEVHNHELLSTFNDISNQLSLLCFDNKIKKILSQTSIQNKLNSITDTNNYINDIIKSVEINLFDSDMQKIK